MGSAARRHARRPPGDESAALEHDTATTGARGAAGSSLNTAEPRRHAGLAHSGEGVRTVAPTRQARGHWFEPSTAHLRKPRYRDLTGSGVDAAKQRYASGTGLGLLYLNQQLEQRAKKGNPINEEFELDAKQAP